MKNSLVFLLLIYTLSACKNMSTIPEKQITFDLSYNHDLDNNDNFSPDNQWLVYDTRTDSGGIAISSKIEKVNVKTGEKKTLYEIQNNHTWGPGAAAVSYSPVDFSVVFIHGLNNSTEKNPYQQWRRTGIIINEKNPGQPIYMDARNVDSPFTVGALRGGTHRHEFSGDGNWIGFTYNDAIMHSLEEKTGEKHNLRTIGVAKRNSKVVVADLNNGENISSDWHSAIVVKVTPNPTPGSDEISNAAGDSWVGKLGYPLKNGDYQIARGFIGSVKDKKGNLVNEVFIVDIPNDITKKGPLGPLEGTMEAMPFPPLGASQRRLTFTAETNHPGCVGVVRSDLSGRNLAYLATDAKGIKQVFTISPEGGTPIQITEHTTNIQGFVRWHPDGKRLFYVQEGRIAQCEIGPGSFTDRMKYLTAFNKKEPTNIVVSHDGKTLAFNRKLSDSKGQDIKQIFAIELP
jgi:Protein of unknown function (DUF3748)